MPVSPAASQQVSLIVQSAPNMTHMLDPVLEVVAPVVAAVVELVVALVELIAELEVEEVVEAVVVLPPPLPPSPELSSPQPRRPSALNAKRET